MIGKLFDNTVSVLQGALDVRAERQRLLASNIANQETPGYKAKDIDFERELRRSVSGGWTLEITDSRHIPTTPAVYRPSVIEAPTAAEGFDDNNVGLEREMVKLSENALMYSVTSKMIRKKFGMVMSAIKEG